MHHRPLLVAVAVSAVLAAVAAPAHAAPPGPWDAFNLSPGADRAQLPTAITSTAGDVTDPQAVLSGKPTRLTGAGARIVLDFGKEVGGTVTPAPHRHPVASGWRSRSPRRSSTSPPTRRPAARVAATARSSRRRRADDYTTPLALQRGGFRYLTLFQDPGGPVDVTGASVHFTFAPTMSDLRDYANYFYSNDPLINRIWYAGAYTVQTNIIAPTTRAGSGTRAGDRLEQRRASSATRHTSSSTAPSATARCGRATSASRVPTDFVVARRHGHDQELAADALQPPERAPARCPTRARR